MNRLNVKVAAAALFLGTAVCTAQNSQKPGINLSYMDKNVSPADDM